MLIMEQSDKSPVLVTNMRDEIKDFQVVLYFTLKCNLENVDLQVLHKGGSSHEEGVVKMSKPYKN